MRKKLKFAFPSAVAVIGVSSPVLAQSRNDGRKADGTVSHERSNSPPLSGGNIKRRASDTFRADEEFGVDFSETRSNTMLHWID